jgi:phospholipase/carboxylesterase
MQEPFYRANSNSPINGPHQQTEPARSGATPDQANGAIIMVHGRGASAQSILTLQNELNTEGMHLVAPQAGGNTWYPYSFLMPVERNEPGISSGFQAIGDLISELEGSGITRNKIILLGFSQGACLATEFIARHPHRYGGLIAFSGGLIGESVDPRLYTGSLDGTPYFVGCSDNDSHIPEERVEQSVHVLKSLGASVTQKIYPGMGHTINRDEIDHAQNIIDKVRTS